jgi:hypothetical protein
MKKRNKNREKYERNIKNSKEDTKTRRSRSKIKTYKITW